MSTTRPSGLKIAPVTESVCNFQATNSRQVLASHNNADLSSDAVTSLLPSGLKSALQTMPEWPRSSHRRLPVFASQMAAVSSLDAVAMRLPSALNATVWILFACP